jgi:beta-lactamase class D
MRSFVLVALILLGPSVAAQQQPDLARHFGGLDGTFVLLDASTGAYTRHNPKRARERFAPCSTFKVPNTAILLESGAAKRPEATVKYDPALEQPKQWARDFDLRGAFKASALWYYQALSRRAGIDTLRRFVERFEYGNRDVSGGIDRTGNPFWVDGTLRISANEQVEFLKRFYEGRLGLSERTTTLTKEIMVAEETSSWRLSAKTGACRPDGSQTSNWYVGYVENGQAVYYFALQIGAHEFGRAYEGRIPISRAILTDLGVLRERRN